MNRKINYIRLDDSFWSFFGNGLISFQYPGMPKELHFTLSMQKDSEYVNLHVTNHAKGSTSKPAIEIARMSREDFRLLLEEWWPFLIESILQPICLKSYRGSRRARSKAYFISFESIVPADELAQDGSTIYEQIAAAWPFLVKGRRLYMPEPHPGMASSLLQDADFRKAVRKALIEISQIMPSSFVAGLAFSRKYSGPAVFFNKQWYAMQADSRLLDGFKAHLEEGLLSDLRDRLAFAIEKTLAASTRAETEQYRGGRIILYRRTPADRVLP